MILLGAQKLLHDHRGMKRDEWMDNFVKKIVTYLIVNGHSKINCIWYENLKIVRPLRNRGHPH